jgi:hypothetical protein
MAKELLRVTWYRGRGVYDPIGEARLGDDGIASLHGFREDERERWLKHGIPLGPRGPSALSSDGILFLEAIAHFFGTASRIRIEAVGFTVRPLDVVARALARRRMRVVLAGGRGAPPTVAEMAAMHRALTGKTMTPEEIAKAEVRRAAFEAKRRPTAKPRPTSTKVETRALPPITWVDVDTLDHCGHGVQFRHIRLRRNVAFIVGFEWQRRPSDPVRVELRSRPVPAATAQWPAIRAEAREAVEAFLTNGHRRYGALIAQMNA